MDTSKFYIANIGVSSEETIIKHMEPIVIHGAQFNAIEVYITPFDAIRALNIITKIKPEQHITIYQSVDEYSSITISNNGESRILIPSDMKFKKHDVMVLGGLVYTL